MRQTLLAAALIGCTIPAIADTVIQQRNPDGTVTTTSIKGDWARMEDSSSAEYQLWNLKTGEMNIVMPEDKTIMVFDLRSKKKTKSRPIEAKLEKLGKGPKIAGYGTTEYRLKAGNRNCGKEFISATAARSPDIRKLVANLATLSNLDELMPGPMGAMAQSMQDPCEAAAISLGDQLPKLGMPLKSTDADGKVEMEITSIDTKAKLDRKHFQLPADYKRTTMKEMMGDAMREMQQMMQQMHPEGQQFLQQLFQGPPK